MEHKIEKSLFPDAIYWPFKRLPELKLLAYANACLETTLNHFEDARIIYYYGVIKSWDLLGCQKLISDFNKCKQDTKNYYKDLSRSVATNGKEPKFPDSWVKVMSESKDNDDLHKLLEYISLLIFAGFNRKNDIENNNPKILAGKSPYLVQTVFNSSLMYHLRVSPDLKNQDVISEVEVSNFFAYYKLLYHPSSRFERRIRPIIKQKIAGMDFKLNHESKRLQDAEMWYGCRVLYAGPEEYSRENHKKNKIFLDPRNVDRIIKDYDIATGYPRRN
jgi:hypothetical protein